MTTWDFRAHAALWTMAVGAAALAPFTVRYFVLGFLVRGLGNGVVVMAALYLAWTARQGKFAAGVTGSVFMPATASFIAWVIVEQGIETSFWLFPLIAATFLILPAVWSWIDSSYIVATGVPAAWMAAGPGAGLRLGVGLVLVAAFSGIAIRLIDSQQRQLELRVVTDPMTGLFNRVRLRCVLEDAVSRRSHELRSASLVSVDIDHFKSINDSYGHLVGDAVIRDVAGIIRDEVPAGAALFRLGGEEFLAVLPGVAEDGAAEIAQRILAAVATRRLVERPVTVSAGVAELRVTDGPDDWLLRVDQALYRAKDAGRNTVAA